MWLKLGSMGSVNRAMIRSGASCSSELAAGSDDRRFACADTYWGVIHHQAGISTSSKRTGAGNTSLRGPSMSRPKSVTTFDNAAKEFLAYVERRACTAMYMPTTPSKAPTMPMIRATMTSALPPPSAVVPPACAERAASCAC